MGRKNTSESAQTKAPAKTGQKRKTGTKKSTVLSNAEFNRRCSLNSSWGYVLKPTGIKWTSQLAEMWMKTSLSAYSFYIQEVAPLQTKLGKLLAGIDGQED
jgi:hypothetical protein